MYLTDSSEESPPQTPHLDQHDGIDDCEELGYHDERREVGREAIRTPKWRPRVSPLALDGE